MKSSPTGSRRYAAGFAAAGALMTIFFLALVNNLTSPGYLWFVYPAFAVIWWPVSILFAHRSPKVFSIIGSLMILLFLTGINLMFSPAHLWVLYAVFPSICWPVILLLGRRAGRPAWALIVSLLAISYYVLLNRFYSPGFPWAVFPAYALVWWPLAVTFAKRGHALLFSVSGTLWSILFFSYLNAVTTPNEIWAVYPIFALLWWPLSVFCFITMRKGAVAK